MEVITKNDLRMQHFNSYKLAIIENIKNNTDVLIDDITLLLKKPPLDSMDIICTKFLDLAKKNKMVLNMDSLKKILDDYRNSVIKCCSKIKKVRIDSLKEVVNGSTLKKEQDVIKINKKDFVVINKEIRKILKDQLNKSFDDYILRKIDSIFKTDVDIKQKDKFVLEISKYMQVSYQKQFFENIDIKIMVKDTTLMNSVKEQAERYLFTLNNSRLLNID